MSKVNNSRILSDSGNRKAGKPAGRHLERNIIRSATQPRFSEFWVYLGEDLSGRLVAVHFLWLKQFFDELRRRKAEKRPSSTKTKCSRLVLVWAHHVEMTRAYVCIYRAQYEQFDVCVVFEYSLSNNRPAKGCLYTLTPNHDSAKPCDGSC